MKLGLKNKNKIVDNLLLFNFVFYDKIKKNKKVIYER